MIIMGINTWEIEVPKEVLAAQALKFSEDVKTKGIAELIDAYIAYDQKMLWCTWKTENLEGLKAAFNEMNKRSGLKSELKVVEKMFSE